MSPFDILIVGELNVDVILSDLQSFPELGTEKLARSLAIVPGSSSAILACNIAALGTQTAFAGKVGNDQFGRFMLETLQERSVDTSQIIMDRTLQTGLTVHLNLPDDRAMVTYLGAIEELRLEDINLSQLSRARHLHMSSYYLQRGMWPGSVELFRTAREQGLTTSLDTNWDPEERWEGQILELLDHIDVFLPNEAEALNIAGVDTEAAALEQLAAHAGTVVIKVGERGAIARTQDRVLRAEPCTVTPVDTVGAGDSFNAGFLHQYLQKAGVETCLEFGNVCGGLSTTQPGGTAAITGPDAVETFRREVSVGVVAEA